MAADRLTAAINEIDELRSLVRGLHEDERG
jgi:hypothetical protein